MSTDSTLLYQEAWSILGDLADPNPGKGNNSAPTRRAPIEVSREHHRIVGVVADMIESGALTHTGIYSNRDLARFVRNVLDAANLADR